VLLLTVEDGVPRVLLAVGVEAGTKVFFKLPYMLSRSLGGLTEEEEDDCYL